MFFETIFSSSSETLEDEENMSNVPLETESAKACPVSLIEATLIEMRDILLNAMHVVLSET